MQSKASKRGFEYSGYQFRVPDVWKTFPTHLQADRRCWLSGVLPKPILEFHDWQNAAMNSPLE